MTKVSEYTAVFCGGDMRMLYAAEKISERPGLRAYYSGFEKAAFVPKNVKMLTDADFKADYLILPMVCTLDGETVSAPLSEKPIPISEALSLIKPGGIVFGGNIPKAVLSKIEEAGLLAADYYKNEELLIENAIPTAEGALAIAMEELPITIFGSKVLVTGYGRVAKTAAKTFSALGASVTVAARKYSDLAWAGFDGCKTEHISNLSSAVKGKDRIIISVPSVIFDKSVLKNTKGLIIDLASKPGGVDFEAAKELGSRVVWALSLPGKTAPVTAGYIIARTITNILSEQV